MNRCVLSLRQHAIRSFSPSRRYFSHGAKRNPFEVRRITPHSIKMELAYIEAVKSAKLVRPSPVLLHEVDFLFESLLLRSMTLTKLELRGHPLWQVFDLFRFHGRPTIWAYNLVLKYCIEAKNYRFFNHIRNIMARDKVTPDIVTINLLLGRAVAMKYEVGDILKEAEAFGIVPNRRTYLLRMQQCAARGDVTFATKIFQEMLKRKYVFEPDDEVFRLLVEAAHNNTAPLAACLQLQAMAKEHGIEYVNWRLCGIRGGAVGIQ